MAWVFEIVGVGAAFVFGAFVGNFYRLIVHRLPGGRFRVVLPPSCPSCGRAERRIWMVPVGWFLILRGRCPRCDFRFRRDILTMELLGGVVAALLFYYYGPTLGFATTFLFCYSFFLNYVVEFRYGVVVPQLYWAAFSIGAAASFLPGAPSPGGALIGGLIPGIFVIITRLRRKGASEGDAALGRQFALVALAGIFLGWQSAAFTLAAATAAASLLPRLKVRFLPRDGVNIFALAVPPAVLVLMFFRPDIIGWYFRVR